MDGLQSDKVNINLGGGDGGGGLGAAAMIAALGNRNEGGDTAGLIAALGNRNNDGMGMAALAPMLAGMNNNGMNNLWPIILLALLGRRGGLGFGGDGDGCGGGVSPGQAALLQTLTEGQSALRQEIPEQTIQLLQDANLNQTATQASLTSVKDAIQNALLFAAQGHAAINQNVSAQGCQTRETVQNDGDKTRALITAQYEANLQRELTVAQSALVEERHASRVRDVEVRVSQTVNQNQMQAQAQAQQQAQFERLFGLFGALSAQVNKSRADQDIINLGTMLASGTQTPTTTQVNR